MHSEGLLIKVTKGNRLTQLHFYSKTIENHTIEAIINIHHDLKTLN